MRKIPHSTTSFGGGFKYTLGVSLAVILVLAMISLAVAGITEYTPYSLNTITWTIQKIDIGGEISEYQSMFDGRFELICPNYIRTNFIVKINTTKDLYELGKFGLDYRYRKVGYGHGEIKDDTEALYYLPENWITIGASEPTSYEKRLRNLEPIRQTVRGDPRFYRGIDYKWDIPFQEIELTVDAVYIYTDTKETGYNFVFRVIENEKDMQIKGTTIEVPSECSFVEHARIP